MMERVNELAKKVSTDSSGRWVSIDEIPALIENVVRECVTVIEDSPRHCAFTTYDRGMVECTIEEVLKQIHSHFGIKKEYRGSNERTLGRKIPS